jgi:hypothetical protein
VLGYNLRSGFKPTKTEIFLKKPITFVSELIMSLYLGKPVGIKRSSSLGFDSGIVQLKSSSVLIGYFQTFKHISSLGLQNFVRFPIEKTQKVLDYKKLAESEKPLVVHIRLGDYAHEANIGILSANYYEYCLKAAWEPSLYKKIWLFSDEPEKAINKIPFVYHPDVRVVDSSGLSSAETLQIMTFGQGYVIANSTFSWWGAYMRENQGAIVYCPKPWFKNMDEPRNIVPDQWKRVSGYESVE